jgi:acetylornithine/N-succinyldiaminopimelate aminotransferase
MATDVTSTTRQYEQEYLFHTYARPDFVVERGEGVSLYDTEGRRYLDFFAGIGVNALGYGDAEVIQTLSEQAQRLVHISNLYHTIPGGELAKLLVEATPGLDRVFFCNSGAEAIEGSLKFARKFAREHHGEGKTTFVAFDGSFHGRTMGAVALTAREKYRLPFMPLMPGVRFAPFNDVEALDVVIDDAVCAVVVEPVQGEGGLRVASHPFLRRIRELCDAHHALLILDEIQCGMGRTGTLWAHEPYQFQPDMMAVAKPLAGGLPIGAVLAAQQVADAIRPGDHGTTFGGGPLITAVAQVVLRRINTPAFLEHVREVSSYLDESLHELAASNTASVLELRGRGLMRGLQVRGAAAEVRRAAQHAGLLVATSGEDVIRLLPPLIVERQHVDEAMEKLTQALAQCQA